MAFLAWRVFDSNDSRPYFYPTGLTVVREGRPFFAVCNGFEGEGGRKFAQNGP